MVYTSLEIRKNLEKKLKSSNWNVLGYWLQSRGMAVKSLFLYR